MKINVNGVGKVGSFRGVRIVFNTKGAVLDCIIDSRYHRLRMTDTHVETYIAWQPIPASPALRKSQDRSRFDTRVEAAGLTKRVFPIGRPRIACPRLPSVSQHMIRQSDQQSCGSE